MTDIINFDIIFIMKRLIKSIDVFSFFIICFLLLFTNCTRNIADNPVETEINLEIAEPLDPEQQLKQRVQKITSSLDDNLLTAQVIISGIDGSGTVPAYMRSIFKNSPVGGVMLFGYNLTTEDDETRAFLKEIVSLLTELSGVPPFISVDHEGGTVNRFKSGTGSLPSAESYMNIFLTEGQEAAVSKVKEDSFKAGTEIKNIGINMNLAPVAEPLIDENRIFMQRRSYGPDINFTALAANAFTEGMKQAGVLCVIKHFPISAGDDPHYSAAITNKKKSELDNLIYPFSVLIKNGARAVMISHTKIPSIDSEISSFSSVVMNTWLRGELGFDGIIIGDDFTMESVQQYAEKIKPEDAAVRSVAAGADAVLVWPPDIRRTHAAFLTALKNGSLSRERLLEAVQRIIYEKLLLEMTNNDEQ